MTIQEALDAAGTAGESCIRRPIGVMRVRILSVTSLYGILMAETIGPLGGMTDVTPRYAITPDDLYASNWTVASGVVLTYAPSPDEKAEGGDPFELTIKKAMDAAGHVCDLIAGTDPVADAAGTKALAEALEAVGNLMMNLKGVENHDRQQEAGE